MSNVEANLRSGVSETDHVQERIHEELSRRVYEKGENVRLLALDRLGIEPNALKPGVHDKVIIKSQSGEHLANVSRAEQISIDNDSTRLIGTRSIRRYVQPNGQMWQITDSSQGAPWIRAELNDAELVEMIDTFQQLGDKALQITVEFSAFRQP